MIHTKLFLAAKALGKFGFVMYRTIRNYEREVPLEDDDDGVLDGKVGFMNNPVKSLMDARFRKRFTLALVSIFEVPAELIRIGRVACGRRYLAFFRTGGKCCTDSLEAVSERLDESSWVSVWTGALTWLFNQYRVSSNCDCGLRVVIPHQHGLRETFRQAYHEVFERYWRGHPEPFTPRVDNDWMLVYWKGREMLLRRTVPAHEARLFQHIDIGHGVSLLARWSATGVQVDYVEGQRVLGARISPSGEISSI